MKYLGQFPMHKELPKTSGYSNCSIYKTEGDPRNYLYALLHYIIQISVCQKHEILWPKLRYTLYRWLSPYIHRRNESFIWFTLLWAKHCILPNSILFYPFLFILKMLMTTLNRFHYYLVTSSLQFVKHLPRWIWRKQLALSWAQRAVFFRINTSGQGLKPKKKKILPEFSSPSKPLLRTMNDSCKVTRHKSSPYFYPWLGPWMMTLSSIPF